MRNETIPADSLFSNRMQGMTLAVIGQLGATAKFIAGAGVMALVTGVRALARRLSRGAG